MRHKILVTAAAAFLLSSVGMASGVALAQVKPSEFKKDSEKKDPAAANTAVAKDEAKAAKTSKHTAAKKAKTAEHKAKAASKDADKAAKDASAPK